MNIDCALYAKKSNNQNTYNIYTLRMKLFMRYVRKKLIRVDRLYTFQNRKRKIAPSNRMQWKQYVITSDERSYIEYIYRNNIICLCYNIICCNSEISAFEMCIFMPNQNYMKNMNQRLCESTYHSSLNKTHTETIWESSIYIKHKKNALVFYISA
jgi:hypothetical protein